MPSTDALVGKTLGSYQIQRELGRGGMGVVYLAHEQSLQRVVAVKVLAPHLAHDATYVKRFVREARAAARLPLGQTRCLAFPAGQFLWLAAVALVRRPRLWPLRHRALLPRRG